MIHFTDRDVEGVLQDDAVLVALRQAFVDFSRGNAAMQPRLRTDCGAVKLSTLGAVLPGSGYAGVKVYTTIAGKFNFVIVLFSARDGTALASFDAGAITRWRTAAVSLLAAGYGARPEASKLALFGTGVQACTHLQLFARAYQLKSVDIVSRSSGQGLAALARQLGLQVRVCEAQNALRDADIVVTATRAVAPLFDGTWVAPGTFVVAVGSSKPDTRELDDALLRRTSAIMVEWREQALLEAGDLLLAAPDALATKPFIELGDALDERAQVRHSDEDIVVFKSVGIGLEDIAIAGLAYERLLPGTQVAKRQHEPSL
jgi:ornithine cyclodeaminase